MPSFCFRPPLVPDVTAETFSEVYDTTDGLELPRSKMSFIAPENLKNGDLVLVEATVHRYHKHKDGKKTVYTEWIANFNLNWIALLDDSLPAAASTSVSAKDEIELSF